MNISRRAQQAGLFIFIFVLLVLPAVFSSDPYMIYVLTKILLYTMLGAGFRLILITGRITIGHMSFVGIGAYSSTLLVTHLNLSFWLCLVLGGLIAAIFAIAFGWVTLRVSGLYFIILTLAMNEVFRYGLEAWPSFTGGITGLFRIPAPWIHIPGVPAVNFEGNETAFYYLILVLAGFGVFVMYRMERSRIGMAFRATGSNDQLAEHLGVNLLRYRVLAFATACFFAGLAGGFTAPFLACMYPGNYTAMESFYIQLYALIGGLSSIGGCFIGSVFMIGVSEFLRFSLGVQPLFYGLALVATAIILPQGLISLPSVIRRQLQKLTQKRVSKHGDLSTEIDANGSNMSRGS